MARSPEKQWESRARRKLVGRKIVGVRLMTPDEASVNGYQSRAFVLLLDDGHCLWPQRDDEGNDVGALASSYEDLPVLPTWGRW